MPRDAKWYFEIDLDGKWKVKRSEKPMTTPNDDKKQLGAVTDVQVSKKDDHVKVVFEDHEEGIGMKRLFFDWTRNKICRKFEAARVSSEAFVKKFKELYQASNDNSSDGELEGESCAYPESTPLLFSETEASMTNSPNNSPNNSPERYPQNCPANTPTTPAIDILLSYKTGKSENQKITQVAEASTCSASSNLVGKTPLRRVKGESKKIIHKRKSITRPSKQEKKIKLDIEEEKDKDFLDRLRNDGKKIEGNFDVLTEMLAGPRDEYCLREIDVKFKDLLKGEILRRPVLFTSPLLCVIQGIQSKSEFDAKCIDSYVLETIGGNHRRLALQELLNDQTVEETDKNIFRQVTVQLYTELDGTDVLRLANLHNKKDEVHAELCDQDKVKLCRQLKGDEGVSEWRKQCAKILIESESKLEYMFFLAQLEDRCFNMLLNVFQKFERIELKDQKAKVKELKEISKKPDCKASPFRFLRSLEPDDMYDLLNQVWERKISVKDMQKEASSIKDMKQVQEALIDTLEEEGWDDVIASYPHASTWEVLEPFKGKVKKGSLTPQFEQFVAQIKKGPDASEFKTTTQNITMSEINYESIGPFLEETTGVGVLFTDLPENWDLEKLTKVFRNLKAINIRKNQTEYTFVLFVKEDMNSSKEIREQEDLTLVAATRNCLKGVIGRVGCILKSDECSVTGTTRDVIIISTNEKVLKCFEKTFLYQGKNEIPRMFFEEFKYFTDPGTLILLVNCAGTVTCHEVFRLTHKIHLIEENPKNIEFLRRRLMLKEEKEDEGRDMAVPLNDDSTLDEN